MVQRTSGTESAEPMASGGRTWFEALLENTADVILVVDARGSIQYASPNSVKVLGFTPADLCGRRVVDLIHPEDLPRALTAGLGIRSGAAPRRPLEVRARHADGSWRIVETVPNNLIDDPNIRGVVHTLRDLTERKRAETAARISHERLNRFVETMSEGMLVFDAEGRVSLANAAAERIFGAQREAIVHQLYSEAPWRRLTFDGKPFPLSDHPFEIVRRTGQPVTGTEFIVERADGVHTAISVNASPMPSPSGGFGGVVALCTDISPRKQAEVRLALALSQLEAELARAARVQADLLPHGKPQIAGFDLAARCVPAREVGGDFYDWQEPLPGRITITLGDVMGKGMPAAVMMATVRAAMRSVVRRSAPGEAMPYVTAALSDDLARAGGFVTLFLAQVDAASGELAYVDAGHGYSFVRRANGDVIALGKRGLPLGIDPNEQYVEGRITIAPGDTLVVYSDGLADARPDLDREALAACVTPNRSAEENADALVGLVDTSTPPGDDMTIVVLTRLGS